MSSESKLIINYISSNYMYPKLFVYVYVWGRGQQEHWFSEISSRAWVKLKACNSFKILIMELHFLSNLNSEN